MSTKEISSMVFEMGKFFLGCYDYRLFLRVSVADGPSINWKAHPDFVHH
jgi:hypothetical protein